MKDGNSEVLLQGVGGGGLRELTQDLSALCSLHPRGRKTGLFSLPSKCSKSGNFYKDAQKGLLHRHEKEVAGRDLF